MFPNWHFRGKALSIGIIDLMQSERHILLFSIAFRKYWRSEIRFLKKLRDRRGKKKRQHPTKEELSFCLIYFQHEPFNEVFFSGIQKALIQKKKKKKTLCQSIDLKRAGSPFLFYFLNCMKSAFCSFRTAAFYIYFFKCPLVKLSLLFDNAFLLRLYGYL